jgi:hypothetical protein
VIQNSLDRILEGIATRLHVDVLPALDDAHAINQVRAAIELLGNLATRTTWDPSYLVDTVIRARSALAVIAESAGPATPELVQVVLDEPSPSPCDVDALNDLRRRTLDALAAGQAWVSEAVVTGHTSPADAIAAIHRFLDWQLTEETERLRTTRFGRP